jgi:hypothetical protein
MGYTVSTSIFMKITIILLIIALLGVSGVFFLDHTNMANKLASANAALVEIQAKSARQTTTATVLIRCANATEKAYVDTKKYVSVVACVKAGLQ